MRYYLLPKTHKRLYNVQVRPVILNNRFFPESISAFFGVSLKAIFEKGYFIYKGHQQSLLDIFILCTIDVVGLYPNTPHKEGFGAIRKVPDKQKDQSILTNSLILSADCVLKNNILKHNMR